MIKPTCGPLEKTAVTSRIGKKVGGEMQREKERAMWA